MKELMKGWGGGLSSLSFHSWVCHEIQWRRKRIREKNKFEISNDNVYDNDLISIAHLNLALK